MRRSGQAGGAGSAAIFIVIVAALIIIYILFLPPDQRAELLADDSDSQGSSTSSATTILLREQIGTISAPTTRELVHSLPSFMVRTQSVPSVLKRQSSVSVTHSPFSEKQETITFFADTAISDNIMLTFNVLKASGELSLTLNGNAILQQELIPGSAQPITISPEELAQQNTLVLSVSGPGGAFWRTNEYVLSSLEIAADLRDLSAEQSELHFAMDQEELQNAQTIRLTYLPRCEKTSNLYITLNGDVLFSGTPACQQTNTIEVDPAKLAVGDNVVVFMTGGAAFQIDQVAVRTQLRSPTHPIYYFNLPAAYRTSQGSIPVVLSLRFADRTTQKTGTVTVNGYTQTFNTKEILWYADISRYLVEGPNSVKLSPGTPELEVVELRVERRR